MHSPSTRHPLPAVIQIQTALPKKRGAASATGYDASYARFQGRVYDAVVSAVRLDVVKCLLLAGPGFAKDKFREFLLERAAATAHKALLAFKPNIATAPASTAYLAGIEARPPSPPTLPTSFGQLRRVF